MDSGHGHGAGTLQVRASCPYRSVSVKAAVTSLSSGMTLFHDSCLFINLCSELQGTGLNKKFLYCCEKWVQLLEKIEETLEVNVADSLPALLEQQKTYEVNLCSPTTLCPHPGQELGKDTVFCFKSVNPWIPKVGLVADSLVS